MINSLLKRWVVSLKYLILLSMVLNSGFFAQKSSSYAAIWLQSESVSVKLGVWDKYGELKSYSALFVVTDPDGKQYKARAKGDESGWTYVSFPDEFKDERGQVIGATKSYPSTVIFSWKCIVGDKTIARGKFEYGSIYEQAKIIRED